MSIIDQRNQIISSLDQDMQRFAEELHFTEWLGSVRRDPFFLCVTRERGEDKLFEATLESKGG